MARNLIVQRNIASLLILALLAACAGSPRVNNALEAQHYQQAARKNYNPPGPPSDPWGPYITEASARFDVPERWVRQVMRVESGGNEYFQGQLITSPTGAMGLMQVEPETYDDLKTQYNLGDDPYDPHDNILAGTAYLRQMYDLFGTPGFLAAYNAGPGRLNEYLAGRTTLPDETRHYVAMIAPAIEGEMPLNRSPSDELAYNQIPSALSPGRRRSGGAAIELASNDGYEPVHRRAVAEPVEVAYLTPPVPPQPPSMSAMAAPRHHGFSLIASAYADTLPVEETAGGPPSWGIQVGAFANRAIARAATVAARQEAPSKLAQAATVIGSVMHGDHIFYRARLAGLTRAGAEGACEQLGRVHTNCIVVSPESST